MALNFNSAGSTRRVDHGSGATIDNLTNAGTMTVWAIVRRTSDGNNQHIVTKDSTGDGWDFLVVNTSGEGSIRFLVFGSPGILDYITASGVVPLNTDMFVLATYDKNATPQVHIYTCPVNQTIPVEVTNFVTANDGAGPTTDASSNLYVGNLQRVNTNPFLGTITRGGILNVVVGAQLRNRLQFMTPTELGALSGARLVWQYTDTSNYSTDYTGNGNTGTLTGATTATDAAIPTLIAPDAISTIYASPYNWYSDGGGALQSNNLHASSTFAQSNTPGAYLRVKPSASSGTPGLWLSVDTSPLNGLTALKCPYIGLSVDDGPLTFTQLVYATTGQTIQLTTGLTSTPNKIKVSFESIDLNSPGDRWVTPAQSVKILGLYRDSALVTLAAPDVHSANAIFYGDSIFEGADANFGTGLTITDNAARYATAPFVADALGAEYGVIAFGGIGIELKGIGNVTPSSSAPSLSNGTAADECYDKYFSGQSRLVSGALSPVPDYAVIRAGVNDGGSLTSAMVTTFIDKVRTVSSVDTYLFVLSYLSNQLAVIDAGVANAAQTARTFAIHPTVVITPGTASKYSSDAASGSQHTNLWGTARDVSELTQAIQSDVGGGSGTAGGSWGYAG